MSGGKAIDKSAGDMIAKAQGLTINGKSLMEWRNDEVVQWLGTIGFEECQNTFREHMITGRILAQLNDSLLKEMGIILVGN